MRVCLAFYRTLALPLIGISAICAHQVWQAQSGYFVFRVLWVKLLTTFVIGDSLYLLENGQTYRVADPEQLVSLGYISGA